MRALELTQFNQMTVVDRPSAAAGPGEVLVTTVATGICGTDLHGYTGANGRRVPGMVMGHETVGRIAAVGEGVDATQFPIGAPVTYNPLVVPETDLEPYAGREQHSPNRYVIGVAPEVVAAFAERIAVPARNIFVLPDSMPIAHGALVEPLAVGLHAVRRTRPRSTDRLLVIGGGPIGQSVVVAAVGEGICQILVSEVDASRRELCAELGAQVIDPTAGPLPGQVVAALGGPADIAIDAVGIDATLAGALESTVLGGTVCLVGMGSPRLVLDAFSITTGERSLIGSFCYSAQDFADAAAYVGTQPTVLPRLISREVSLDEAPEAFRALAVALDVPGKVLVRFDR